jgi:GTP cyclohydrolase II
MHTSKKLLKEVRMVPEDADDTNSLRIYGNTTEVISFDNLCDNAEHIALVFPGPDKNSVPLVRLHSECMTGDVFGSAHCDCGPQLHEAISLLSAQGGILLYLRQEGRGIGLYNKLDAYHLQHEKGLDTFTANKHLGFEIDQRDFRVAAQMLETISFTQIRLLTNNPDKVSALRHHGIDVAEQVKTGRYETDSNRHYLETKRRAGHSV